MNKTEDKEKSTVTRGKVYNKVGAKELVRENGKKENLRKVVEEERLRSESYLTQLRYLQADFDNYRKRVQTDIDDKLRQNNTRFLLKIIGIGEDIDRAIIAIGKYSKGPLFKGLQLVKTNIEQVLNDDGVEAIKALDQKFDPYCHEAVSFAERNNVDDNTIIGEVRKGYTVHGKVLRTSLVDVVRTKRKVNQNSIPKI